MEGKLWESNRSVAGTDVPLRTETFVETEVNLLDAYTIKGLTCPIEKQKEPVALPHLVPFR